VTPSTRTMKELLALMVICLASLELAAVSAASSDNKVVRMKRNYEEPIDLEFHHPDETNLVRIKRHRRSAEEPSLVRVKRDEDELQRYKRQKRDAEDELHRFKRQKRDAEDELQRYKRQKRSAEDELERYKRIDPEPELARMKRSKREVEASPALAQDKKETKEKKSHPSNHHQPQRGLKREKKTNMNHRLQNHEKRSFNSKHHPAPQLRNSRNSVLRSHHRSDYLASHDLRNVHLVSKRNRLGTKGGDKSGKHPGPNRVKRTQVHQPHPYNRLEADVAKLGRLRRDIALNLHKANLKDAAKRRVKRTHLKKHKKFAASKKH